MSKKRRTFSAEFKCRVALEALKEQEPINAIASRYDVLPVQVSQWKAQVLESIVGVLRVPARGSCERRPALHEDSVASVIATLTQTTKPTIQSNQSMEATSEF
jgi:transposase